MANKVVYVSAAGGGAILFGFVVRVGATNYAITFFTFPMCCFISKPERLKCDWGRKSRQHFGLFGPL